MAKNKINHLLVIRLSAMGDVAMTVPVLMAFLRAYPDIKVTILTRGNFGPLFSEIPDVTVFEADVKGRHKGIFGLWRLYRELKDIPIDAIADLHNVIRSKVLKFFFRNRDLPFVQIDKGRKEKKLLTAWRKKDIYPLQSTHERYADVFRNLGFDFNPNISDILPRIAPFDLTAKWLQNGELKNVGIAPFAAFKGKMYPSGLMEEVIKKLNNTNQYKIFLFGGGASEKQQLQYLSDRYSNCINATSVLSFSDELVLISNLDLMVSMDSGNAHLAAMYGVPTLTLWGVTHPFSGFLPFGQDIHNALLSDRVQYPFIPTSVYGNKYPKGYEQAIATIDPQDVINKIHAMLS